MLSFKFGFLLIVGAIMFFYSRISMKKMASDGITQYKRYVDAIVSETLGGSAGYQVGLGYLVQDGWSSSIDAALEYNITHSTTGAYKYYKYYIAALGEKDITFIPCKFRSNMLKGLIPQRDEEREVESYSLEQVDISKIKDAKNGMGGTNSVEMEFVFPDEKQPKRIDFFIRPEIWQGFAVTS